ncbi:transcription antitermination factor NusB [Nannocystis sp.]|uniref:RsmB/NOP family class I SAM-dependent RNA methyltransferase n=1 Tax=Nannocystis sp. TaxID=1962667 RepID=UPI0025DCEDD1|nr:transcription antitermination factor NusB [Nannocystis sp.]MBK7824952.1 methyltransferase domain-containing protein [Nannocystis sp.]
MQAPTARGLAIQILRQLDQREGFSNRVLAGHLLAWSADLARRDRGLVTLLVYGVLRHRARLDALIDTFADRPQRLSARLRELLRVAAFELRELGRPAHVAISQAQAQRETFDPSGALRGLVQAVLAGIERGGAELDAKFAANFAVGKPLDALALRWSIPRWLAGRMLKQLGPERALARAQALAVPPPVDLRVDLSRTTAEAVAEAIRAADPRASVETVPGQPQALRVRGGGELHQHPLYHAGHFAVQGLGAQQAALALGPCPGEHVLDACCGMGTKTLQLAELMDRRGVLVAVDLSAERLDAQLELRQRGGLDVPGLELRSLQADLSQAELPGVDELRYDAILLDAPCTGLGNLGRHPELRWTCRYEDIAACAALQRSLLVRCIGRLRPGGRLVYAVCSLEPEEGPELVKAVAAEHGLHVELEQAWTPEQEATDGFYLARLRLS